MAVADALKKKQFSTAQSLTGTVNDPIAKSLGQWMYLMAQDPKIDFNDADAFLDANIDWPMQYRISSFIEDKIPDSAPADEVLAFFDTREPVTGEGKIQLARALFSVGDKFGGERYVRDAWINHNFKLSEEQRILSVYGGYLTPEEHAARVDRLLWARQVTNARRVISKLSGDDRRMAEARVALILSAANATKLYNRLSAQEQLDSGVLLAAVRYYRRRGDESKAISLATQAPEDPDLLRNGERWWFERQLLMRWALRNGRFADAYSLAAEHRMTSGGDYAEAEFYAGWIALRFLNSPARAETHFLALASEVDSPISVSRSKYWLGRAAAARGETEQANAYYKVASKHYYSYYGQLAAEELGLIDAAKFAPPQQSSAADRALFASRPTVSALKMLTDLDLDYEFMVFAYHVDDQLERPGEYLELAKLTDGEGAPHLTVRAGKVGIQRGAFAPEVAYPLVFVPDEAKRFVSPEIILGLSRQESEFNPRAYSRAGARGIMQLIPSTAQITARKEGLPYIRSALLDDPVYNMTIGSAHLSHLLERFDGSLIMTLAGYNAGAARVDRWITEYGDPRSSTVDPLDWVELIPFSETRNYVQRVLENVQVYRGRINDKPIPGRLYSDIERGGPRDRVASLKPPSIVLANAAASYAAPTLPALPKRTEERARRYAQQLRAEPAAPLTAPKQATGASPIAFEQTAAAEQTRPNKVERSASKIEQPVSSTLETDAAALAEQAPEKTSITVTKTAMLQMPVPQLQPRTDDAQEPAAAPSIKPVSPAQQNVATDAETEPSPSAPASSTIIIADGIDQERIAKILARMPTPGQQSSAAEPQTVTSRIETCLTDIDGDASDDEEEDLTASLNAEMLASMRGADEPEVNADC
ncbi:transglycosylase SLT domain-containing protein [Hyphococcus flavus]|uniref:Transglycosylase SLT domain-containing protein n=1 Tax=Hyphococcus flavus TaxID=1866326 RepID=A0AAF0CBB4_9PROT|nr:transglycosylase SLT domain-containing protein [Hyphococcus flavus]WDI30520.1 transglycosylase SLT domain-containing protein [Hyphococcus flavus]